MAVPQFKEIRKAYGFDDVAISPGVVTINPDQVNREFSINGMTMPMPVLASAMDAIVSPSFAVEFDKRGGLAVMNLEGVQTRYDDPAEVLDRHRRALYMPAGKAVPPWAGPLQVSARLGQLP